MKLAIDAVAFEYVEAVLFDGAFSVCGAIDRFVVDDDNLTIRAQMYIELDAVYTQIDGFLETGQRILTKMPFGATVSDVEDFHEAKIKNALL